MVEGIAERPSMDLFKAIFADDESAEESFSEDDAVEGTASVEIGWWNLVHRIEVMLIGLF